MRLSFSSAPLLSGSCGGCRTFAEKWCGDSVLWFMLRGCESLCQPKRRGAADQRPNRKHHFRADGRAHEESAREQRRFGRLLLSFASAREKVLQLWAGK